MQPPAGSIAGAQTFRTLKPRKSPIEIVPPPHTLVITTSFKLLPTYTNATFIVTPRKYFKPHKIF